MLSLWKGCNMLQRVTTPIFYVNSSPHLGHAYSLVVADAIARWNAKRTGNIHHLFTGTDEHGQKVYEAALSRGHSTPIEWCNKVSQDFRDLADSLNVKYNRFIRTTDSDHANVVHSIWKRLREEGVIYKGKHGGWYSVSDECFYGENDVELSTDESGKEYNRSIATGKEVKWIEEENYMFKVSSFREKILNWLKESNVIYPENRRVELLNYLENKDQCKDISVSRRREACKWGLEVPDNELSEPQVIYVWFDALLNYLTVGGYPQNNNTNPTPDIQILGKDILRFHGIIWPSILLSLNLPLPKKLIVHGHWTINGWKMSKSDIKTVIEPKNLIQTYGTDSIRYYLLKESRFDTDADFNEADLVKITNNDLSNKFGNLISRSFNSKFVERAAANGGVDVPKNDHIFMIDNLYYHAAKHFDQYQFVAGIDKANEILSQANSLFTEHSPWNTNLDQVQMEVLLKTIQYSLIKYSNLMQHVMPNSCSKVLNFFKEDTTLQPWTSGPLFPRATLP